MSATIISGTNEYYNLHRRIRALKGKATKCVECGSAENVQWANISGEYLEDPDDYKELCSSCHGRFDTGRKRSWSWSADARKRQSERTKGRKPWNKGKRWPESVKVKLREAHAARDITGSKNPNWRGGTSAKYNKKGGLRDE